MTQISLDQKRGIEMLEAFQKRTGKYYSEHLAYLLGDEAQIEIAISKMELESSRARASKSIRYIRQAGWKVVSRIVSWEKFSGDAVHLRQIIRIIAGDTNAS